MVFEKYGRSVKKVPIRRIVPKTHCRLP